MTDVVVHKLERYIREEAELLIDPATDAAVVRARLISALDAVRYQIQRRDELRLETLIERLTAGHANGSR